MVINKGFVYELLGPLGRENLLVYNGEKLDTVELYRWGHFSDNR